MSEEVIDPSTLDPTKIMSTPAIKQRILIGTPCYGGQMFCSYTDSLIQTRDFLAAHGIGCDHLFISNESLIPRGRNTVAAKFLSDPKWTHLLFIDADLSWNPRDVLRLIQHDKDLIGGVYPKKNYNWKRLQHLDLEQENIDNIPAKLTGYTINYSQDRRVVNGLIRVLHIATGFMMIKRSVFEKMMESFPHLKYTDDIGMLGPRENPFLYAFFDLFIQDGHYLSEDYAFCKRWIDLGGEVYADLNINLTHTGTHSFKGNISSTLQIERSNETTNRNIDTQEKDKSEVIHKNENENKNKNENNNENENNSIQRTSDSGVKMRVTNRKQSSIAQLIYDRKNYATIKRRPQLVEEITEENMARRIREMKESIVDYPSTRFAGRGIVICANNTKYYKSATTLVRWLREVLGCTLGIEWFYMGDEMNKENVDELYERWGVICRDVLKVKEEWLNDQELGKHWGEMIVDRGGYELKPFALLTSSFKEVILIDADNLPLRDPSYLFDSPIYGVVGSLFWRDLWDNWVDKEVYKLAEITRKWEGSDLESGQVVINKAICWRSLQMAWLLNNHSYLFYRYFVGDKDLFGFAWNIMEQTIIPNSYLPQAIGFYNQYNGDEGAMKNIRNERGDIFVGNAMLHFDYNGDPLFAHMTLCKPDGTRKWEKVTTAGKHWKILNNGMGLIPINNEAMVVDMPKQLMDLNHYLNQQ